MGLFSGLEKFGFNVKDVDSIYEEPKQEKEEAKEEKTEASKTEVKPPEEKEFLVLKFVKCPVCDLKFRTQFIKTGKARRIGADRDLRPRFSHIDTLKYDVVSCPKCGYAAITRGFEGLSLAQAKLVRDQICVKFEGKDAGVEDTIDTTYSYEYSIEQHKLALLCTIVKRAGVSEKAYTCLKISWLYRGMIEEILKKDPEADVSKLKEEEQEYYVQAYEGFQMAISKENYPICGMDQETLDYLIATIAFNLGKLEQASRFLSAVILSKTAKKGTKDKALELKEEIIAAIKNSKA